MNILLIFLVYIAPQQGLDCRVVPSQPEQFVPVGLTDPPATVAHPRLLAAGQARPAPGVADELVVTSASIDTELLFYLDLHAQALSNNVSASLNPWVQLHPVGAEGAVFATEVSAPDGGEQPAGYHGNGRSSGNGHACS